MTPESHMTVRRAWRIARHDEWNDHNRRMGWDAAVIPRRPLWKTPARCAGVLLDDLRFRLAMWITP